MNESPQSPEEFGARFRRFFESNDWDALRELCLVADEQALEVDCRLFRLIHEEGFFIARCTVQPYEQPNWSVFNDHRFEPVPAFSMTCELEHRRGFRKTLYFALAQGSNGFQRCYYVPKPKSRKPLSVDLRKDRKKIAGFIEKSVTTFAQEKNEALTSAMEIHYSLEEGFVSVSFHGIDNYRPGLVPFSPSETLLMPKWNSISDSPSVEVLPIDGEKWTFAPEDTQKMRRLINDVGDMIVSVLREVKDNNAFKKLPRRDLCELHVEEISGEFGWPALDERGKENLI